VGLRAGLDTEARGKILCLSEDDNDDNNSLFLSYWLNSYRSQLQSRKGVQLVSRRATRLSRVNEISASYGSEF
jgi:hypothetical protein